jgi:hypothetical protein
VRTPAIGIAGLDKAEIGQRAMNVVEATVDELVQFIGKPSLKHSIM